MRDIAIGMDWCTVIHGDRVFARKSNPIFLQNITHKRHITIYNNILSFVFNKLLEISLQKP